MTDKYDKQALSLVEHCRYCTRSADDGHFDISAIAAALRLAGDEIERLKEEIRSLERWGSR